ncbi:MAG: hypothetical protein ACRDV9_09065, partial [Acidimicrobiia bacterium]
GPIDPADDGKPFRADWEARIFALNLGLLRKGAYALDEFRDSVERIPPARYVTASYYERWLEGIESLLVAKGHLAPADLEASGEAPVG